MKWGKLFATLGQAALIAVVPGGQAKAAVFLVERSMEALTDDASVDCDREMEEGVKTLLRAAAKKV